MHNFYRLMVVTLFLTALFMQNSAAQKIPTVSEVNSLIKDNHLLVTYREGGVLYGTYYFLDIHYCPAGYGLYGKSIKKTVMGNEQHNNWQEFGTWKVMEYNGNVGVYYKPTNALEKFVPLYRLPDGSLTTGEGVTIVKQGKAICN